jgi:hypothetical protein
MSSAGSTSSRIWRLRKRQQTIDALLHQGANSSVTLEFVLNGRRITARAWPTRREAVKAAVEKRKELERAGWATHW